MSTSKHKNLHTLSDKITASQPLVPWDYHHNPCFISHSGCHIDFSMLTNISEFEDWVIAFRTGGTKVADNNLGFSLTNIDKHQALLVTQSDSRDGGGSRRTEAKVANFPVGDYEISFDLHLHTFPDNFDTTISQIKCGSGKPPINVKLTHNGGVRVKSGGDHALKNTFNVFVHGWNRVVYKIENTKGTLTLAVNGRHFDINQNNTETDCANIYRAGSNYILKIGLYEDDIKPGYSVAYKNLTLRRLKH